MLNREEYDRIKEAAYKAGVPIQSAILASKRLEQNPHEHLQPGDPRFERVYGEKIRKQKERDVKNKRDDEMLNEDIKRFEEDKLKRLPVHRKYTQL